MDSLIVFSKIFNIEIVDNKLTIPQDFDIFKLPINIRSIIYTYFHLVSKHINGLTWVDLGKIMNEDEDLLYIDNVDPELYYSSNVELYKFHKQDYEFMHNNINRVKVPLCYKNIGWNLNYYCENGLMTIEQISKIKYASNVLHQTIIEKHPNLFNIDVIFERFGLKFDISNFSTDYADNYRLKCMEKFDVIDFNNPKWYSSNKRVLENILLKNPKILNTIFEDCVLNSCDSKRISELYLKWFCQHRKQNCRFDNLLKLCSNIDKLFELGVYLPFTALESFNYNSKYITPELLIKITPSFTSGMWLKNGNLLSYYKDIIDFEHLPTKECIYYFNNMYEPTSEFYQKVFKNKSLRLDNIRELKRITYEQAKCLLVDWNERRGIYSRLYEILMKKISIIEIYKLINENILPSENNIGLINMTYQPKDYDIIFEYIHKNNIIVNNHTDIELIIALINNEQTKNNISWKIIDSQFKFDNLFYHFIKHNIKVDYKTSLSKIHPYIHNINDETVKIITKKQILDFIIIPLSGKQIVLDDETDSELSDDMKQQIKNIDSSESLEFEIKEESEEKSEEESDDDEFDDDEFDDESEENID